MKDVSAMILQNLLDIDAFYWYNSNIQSGCHLFYDYEIYHYEARHGKAFKGLLERYFGT